MGELAFVQHFKVDKALSHLPLPARIEPCCVLRSVFAALELLSVIRTVHWTGSIVIRILQMWKLRPERFSQLPKITQRVGDSLCSYQLPWLFAYAW